MAYQNSTSVTKKTSGEQKKLPAGATVVSREVSTEVEEIENGFLICKREEIRYTLKKDSRDYPEYLTIYKKWFSKEDPITVSVEDKELADAFEEY